MKKAKKARAKALRISAQPYWSRVRRFLVEKYALPKGASVTLIAGAIMRETKWRKEVGGRGGEWALIEKYGREILKDYVVPRRKKVVGGKTFYTSREWLHLRYAVIQKYGRKCMCCGATNKKIHVDHVKPRSKFPELELVIGNLQILCEDCNLGKGAWDQTDWRTEVEAAPEGESLDAQFRATMGRMN